MPIFQVRDNIKLVCFKHFEDQAPMNVQESQALHAQLVDRYVHDRLKPLPKTQRVVNGRTVGQHPVATGVLLVDTNTNTVLDFGFSVRNFRDAWNWKLGRQIALQRLNLSNAVYLEDHEKEFIHKLLLQEVSDSLVREVVAATTTVTVPEPVSATGDTISVVVRA